MELTVEIFARILDAARILIGAAFVLGLLVAATHWLVREQKIAAFGGWARFVRRWSDPVLRPIERKLVGAGGNPQHAPWWLLGVIVVGGLILINLLEWLFSLVLSTLFAVHSGPNATAALVINLVFSLLKENFPFFGKVTEGLPLIIVNEGKPLLKRMRKSKVSEEDVL